jgi:hypothetical protein
VSGVPPYKWGESRGCCGALLEVVRDEWFGLAFMYECRIGAIERVTPILCIVIYEVLRPAVNDICKRQLCGVCVLAAKHTSICLHGAHVNPPNPRVAVFSRCCRNGGPPRQHNGS